MQTLGRYLCENRHNSQNDSHSALSKAKQSGAWIPACVGLSSEWQRDVCSLLLRIQQACNGSHCGRRARLRFHSGSYAVVVVTYPIVIKACLTLQNAANHSLFIRGTERIMDVLKGPFRHNSWGYLKSFSCCCGYKCIFWEGPIWPIFTFYFLLPKAKSLSYCKSLLSLADEKYVRRFDGDRS